MASCIVPVFQLQLKPDLSRAGCVEFWNWCVCYYFTKNTLLCHRCENISIWLQGFHMQKHKCYKCTKKWDHPHICAFCRCALQNIKADCHRVRHCYKYLSLCSTVQTFWDYVTVVLFKHIWQGDQHLLPKSNYQIILWIWNLGSYKKNYRLIQIEWKFLKTSQN